MDNLKIKWIKIAFIPKIFVGFLISVFYSLFLKKKTIILVGGHVGERFDDNAKEIFNFLKKQKNLTVFWCYSNKRNYDLKTINGRVVKLGSIFNYILYFNADFVFFSHSCSTDIAPVAQRVPFKRPFKVFLGHGPDGLKVRSNTKLEDADIYTCTSEFEYGIKNREWKISSKNLAITGLARCDRYDKNTFYNGQIKEILFMPTWRDWNYVDSMYEFKKSEFYQKINQILHDEQLHHLLEKNDAVLKVKLHPFFSKFRSAFSTLPYKEIQFSTASIGSLIKNTDMLITDYSSISFDYLFLEKPIIFYQFDAAQYLQSRGSYINFDDELFGIRCTNITQLLDAIKLCLKGQAPNVKQQKLKYFPFSDTCNCERIWETALVRSQSKI